MPVIGIDISFCPAAALRRHGHMYAPDPPHATMPARRTAIGQALDAVTPEEYATTSKLRLSNFIPSCFRGATVSCDARDATLDHRDTCDKP